MDDCHGTAEGRTGVCLGRFSWYTLDSANVVGSIALRGIFCFAAGRRGCFQAIMVRRYKIIIQAMQLRIQMKHPFSPGPKPVRSTVIVIHMVVQVNLRSLA